jgi:serine/threonine protein phosphatase 1
MEWLEHSRRPELWLNQGGNETLDSYPEDFDKSIHLEFFKKALPYYIEDDIVFVHAGWTKISNRVDDSNNIEEDYYWNRFLWRYLMDCSLNEQGFPVKIPHRHVFKGHDTTLFNEAKPITIFNVTNLDTGSAYGGKLTVMELETRNYWQI